MRLHGNGITSCPSCSLHIFDHTGFHWIWIYSRNPKWHLEFFGGAAGEALSRPRKDVVTAYRKPKFESASERWVTSVREECLSRLSLFGEGPCDER